MKLFIDTASVDEIKKANDMGIICGVTTNPSLVAKEGKIFEEVVKEICEIVDGPVSAEVISLNADEMVKEGLAMSKWSDSVVVKVPMTSDGLKAVKSLAKMGVKTNVTLVFSANQALLAARAGAAYVSPFVGRMDDISTDGMRLVEDIVEIFDMHCIDTEVIAASIRHPQHVTDAALAGAHIATVPYKVMETMIKHPLTDAGIEKFMADWKNAKV